MVSKKEGECFMLVWKKWSVVRRFMGEAKTIKEYRILLLFGIIPLFVSING
jgi:hypothetical protein